MKIRVERDVLAEAVAWAARSLPARPRCRSSPGCCSKAEDGQLSLSGFDYEVSARVAVEAEVEEEGTRPGLRPAARRHLPRAAQPPGGDLHRRRQGSTVVCGSSRFTLHTLPVEEYPALPAMPVAVRHRPR